MECPTPEAGRFRAPVCRRRPPFSRGRVERCLDACRPPSTRTRGRAATLLSPAVVRSCMSARSDSASAPFECCTNLPAALEVSICSPCDRRPPWVKSSTSARNSGRERPTRSGRVTTAMSQAAAEPPARQGRCSLPRPRNHVSPHTPTTGRGQGIDLAGSALITGRHPRVSDFQGQ